MRTILPLTLVLYLLTASRILAASLNPGSEEQKTLYALGLAISQSLANFSLSEVELE